MTRETLPGSTAGPKVIFGVDHTGRCTLSCGPGLRDLGLEQGELVGRNLFEVYAHDPSAQEAIRRALDGESFTSESDFQGRILSVFYQPVRDEQRQVTGVYGVATDVTAQRRIEREIQEARDRASLLADLTASLTQETLDPASVLAVVARSATEALGDVGAVWLRTRDGERLEPRSLWHVDESVRTVLTEQLGNAPSPPSLAVSVAAELDKPQVLDIREATSGEDGDQDLLSRGAEALGLVAFLRAPLRSRGHLVGFLEVGRADERSFGEDAISLMTDIAERCSLALDNALLLDAHRSAREELVNFQALAEASSDLIAISGNDDSFLYANPRIADYGIGLSAEGVFDSAVTVLGEEVTAEIRESLRKTGRWSGEFSTELSTGRLVGDLDAFHLSHPTTGALLGTAWIARDITDLRVAEESVRAANAELMKFKALVEASPDFIAIADLDGTVRYLNPNGRALIGMPADLDVSTTSIPDYLTHEGLEASLTIEQPAVIAHGHWEGESTLRHRDGSAIPVAISSFLMRDAQSGEPFGLATVQRDISERRAAETALRDLAEQRQALLSRLVDAQDEERARIAADVHDDPVQALAAVDIRLGLLGRRLRVQAPELLEDLSLLQETVSTATDRLRALLFDLEPPDLQRGLAGALRRVAGELFENTDTRWSVDGDHEPDLPDATRAIAYLIVKEAMSNTLKHAEATAVTVTVGERDAGLEVTVADDGVGLPVEELRSSSPGHRGVRTMQDRAEAGGGKCEIGARHPRGTLVTLWLPGPSSL